MRFLKLLLLLAIFLSALSVGASNLNDSIATDSVAPSNWKVGGITTLTFNQVSLTNWSGGGSESMSGNGMIKSYFNYSHNKVAWDNTFDIAYGMSKQGDDNAIKTEDKLQFSTKLGYSAGKHWYYSAMADFKTQMDKGYKDPPTNSTLISGFMAPAYITNSIGMDYKPSENLSLYLSPFTSKLTMVNNQQLADSGAYGVERGENMRSEFGASMKFLAKKKDILKNVDGLTRLELFSNLANNPENIDVDFEAVILMRINKLLTAMISFNVIYDDDVAYIDEQGIAHGARPQVKQMVGFGVSYKFGHSKEK